MPSLIPTMPGTHTWVQGGPMLAKAGRAALYGAEGAAVLVWDADTGLQVTDLRNAGGTTVSSIPITDGWVDGVGVPVAVKLPMLSVGVDGKKFPAIPAQTFRDAASALAPTDAQVATLLGNPASASRVAGDVVYSPLSVGGKTAVRKDSLVINVKDYGALGDGSTNDTTAIQNAINAGGITYFPAGTYIAGGLVGKDGMVLLGATAYGLAGTGRTRLRTTSGDLFTTSGYVHYARFENIQFDTFTGGGHVFTGQWATTTFDRCVFVSYLDAKSCFNVTGWIDVLVTGCTFDHTLTATVPTFKALSATGELAQSAFLSCRFTSTGDYGIHLEATGGAVVANITMRDINFENPKGGAIRLYSARNCSIEHVGMWDMGAAATKDLVLIGTSPTSGAVSSGNEVSHYLRDASTGPGAGIYDIKVNTGTTNTLVVHPRHQLTSQVFVNYNDTSGTIICGASPFLENVGFATVIGPGYVRPPQSTTGARPSASTAGAGASLWDSTIGKPIWSNGTVWKDAAGTTV